MAIIKVNTPEKAARCLPFTPSPYQEDIFDAIRTGKGNILVEAVAGSGKTTTIVHGLSLIPEGSRCLFVAFNKAIADTLKEQAPQGVDVSTFHSLGLRMLREMYGKVKVDVKKLRVYLQKDLLNMSLDAHRGFYMEHGRVLLGIVEGFQGQCRTCADDTEIADVLKAHTQGPPVTPLAITCVREMLRFTWELAVEGETLNVSFSDMISMPAVFAGAGQARYDYVLVDEAQDLNGAQRRMLSKVMLPGARLIAVGDRAQAIYAFRGADHTSMDLLGSQFGCKEYPLSISYRCPRAVVGLAKRDCDAIQAAPDAPLGIVREAPISEFNSAYVEGSYILCRTWAPLVREAMHMAARGESVCVAGRNMVPALARLATEIANIFGGGYVTQKALGDYRLSLLSHRPQRREYLEEQADILSEISSVTEDPKEIKKALYDLFTDDPKNGRPVFTTIHRAKGLEADTVYLLRPDLIPHRLAVTPEEIKQEFNLRYVAVTRAKRELIMLTKEGE